MTEEEFVEMVFCYGGEGCKANGYDSLKEEQKEIVALAWTNVEKNENENPTDDEDFSQESYRIAASFFEEFNKK